MSPAIPAHQKRPVLLHELRAESRAVPGVAQGRKPSLGPILAAGSAQEGQQHQARPVAGGREQRVAVGTAG